MVSASRHPATTENCSGCGRNPRCIGAGRSTSVRTAPARPAQPPAVRCVRTLFAHMLKRPGPPAPAPKELAVLPPWPAAASTDRHRQKYSLCFKVPSAVQTRPAVPLGSHSRLPFPHSLRQCVPVSHLFAPVLKRRSPSARGQQVPALPMAGGYRCGLLWPVSLWLQWFLWPPVYRLLFSTKQGRCCGKSGPCGPPHPARALTSTPQGRSKMRLRNSSPIHPGRGAQRLWQSVAGVAIVLTYERTLPGRGRQRQLI